MLLPELFSSRNQGQVVSLVSELHPCPLRGHEKARLATSPLSALDGLAPRPPSRARGAQLGARLGQEVGEGQVRHCARQRVAARGRILAFWSSNRGQLTEVGGASKEAIRIVNRSNLGCDFPLPRSKLRATEPAPARQPAAPCFRLATGPRSAPPAAESRGHSPPHQRRARQGRQRSQGESQAKPRSVRRRFGGCRRRCRRAL